MKPEDITTYNDRMRCYAAYALVLGDNKPVPTSGLVGIMTDEFPKFTKNFNRDSLAQALSNTKDIFFRQPQQSWGGAYVLAPRFYSFLAKQIEKEAKPLLAKRLAEKGQKFTMRAAIMCFYERQKARYTKPTLTSVFRQVRKSFSEQTGRE